MSEYISFMIFIRIPIRKHSIILYIICIFTHTHTHRFEYPYHVFSFRTSLKYGLNTISLRSKSKTIITITIFLKFSANMIFFVRHWSHYSTTLVYTAKNRIEYLSDHINISNVRIKISISIF